MPKQSPDMYGNTFEKKYRIRNTMFGAVLEQLIRTYDDEVRWKRMRWPLDIKEIKT